MKKIFSIAVALLVLSLAFTACDNDEAYPGTKSHEIKFDKNEFFLPYEGGQFTAHFAEPKRNSLAGLYLSDISTVQFTNKKKYDYKRIATLYTHKIAADTIVKQDILQYTTDKSSRSVTFTVNKNPCDTAVTLVVFFLEDTYMGGYAQIFIHMEGKPNNYSSNSPKAILGNERKARPKVRQTGKN